MTNADSQDSRTNTKPKRELAPNKSLCHNAPVTLSGENREGATRHYICGTCHQPCDLQPTLADVVNTTPEGQKAVEKALVDSHKVMYPDEIEAILETFSNNLIDKCKQAVFNPTTIERQETMEFVKNNMETAKQAIDHLVNKRALEARVDELDKSWAAWRLDYMTYFKERLAELEGLIEGSES